MCAVGLLALHAGSGGEENEEAGVAGEANTRLAFREGAAELDIGDGHADACASCVSSANAKPTLAPAPALAPATTARPADAREVMTEETEPDFRDWP